jgi:hypothetical protein
MVRLSMVNWVPVLVPFGWPPDAVNITLVTFR